MLLLLFVVKKETGAAIYSMFHNSSRLTDSHEAQLDELFIMRHRDPRLTTETYGHLEVDDMRIALDELAERTAPLLQEATAASDRQSLGTHVVPSAPESAMRARARASNSARALSKSSGPSRIRTWDQSVMSRQL